MTCVDPQISFIHLVDDTTVFASDSDINNVHATVNRELVLVITGSWPTDFLTMLVKLHI